MGGFERAAPLVSVDTSLRNVVDEHQRRRPHTFLALGRTQVSQEVVMSIHSLEAAEHGFSRGKPAGQGASPP